MIARAWKVALVVVAVGSVVGGLVFAEAPRAGASSSPPPVATVSTEVCRQTCESEVAQVAFRVTSSSNVQARSSAANDCPARAQVVVPCAPYGCDGQTDTCRSRCDSDGQCAEGFVCKESSHRCVALTYSCNGNTLRGTDGSTHDCSPGTCAGSACQGVTYSCQSSRYVKGTDGSSHDCMPYNCVAGTCEHSCNSVDNCISPTVCDQSGHCIYFHN